MCREDAQADWVPTRLLEASDAGLVRVVMGKHVAKNSPDTFQYFTLSHVWGSEKPLTLNQATESQLRQGMPLQTLPACFRDALNIALNLGCKYLWVDSLWYVAPRLLSFHRRYKITEIVYSRMMMKTRLGNAGKCTAYTPMAFAT
jgi:hypothetical protein